MIPKLKYLKSAACYSSFFHHNKAYSISIIVRFAQKLKLSLVHGFAEQDALRLQCDVSGHGPWRCGGTHYPKREKLHHSDLLPTGGARSTVKTVGQSVDEMVVFQLSEKKQLS